MVNQIISPSHLKRSMMCKLRGQMCNYLLLPELLYTIVSRTNSTVNQKHKFIYNLSEVLRELLLPMAVPILVPKRMSSCCLNKTQKKLAVQSVFEFQKRIAAQIHLISGCQNTGTNLANVKSPNDRIDSIVLNISIDLPLKTEKAALRNQKGNQQNLLQCTNSQDEPKPLLKDANPSLLSVDVKSKDPQDCYDIVNKFCTLIEENANKLYKMKILKTIKKPKLEEINNSRPHWLHYEVDECKKAHHSIKIENLRNEIKKLVRNLISVQGTKDDKDYSTSKNLAIERKHPEKQNAQLEHVIPIGNFESISPKIEHINKKESKKIICSDKHKSSVEENLFKAENETNNLLREQTLDIEDKTCDKIPEGVPMEHCKHIAAMSMSPNKQINKLENCNILYEDCVEEKDLNLKLQIFNCKDSDKNKRKNKNLLLQNQLKNRGKAEENVMETENETNQSQTVQMLAIEDKIINKIPKDVPMKHAKHIAAKYKNLSLKTQLDNRYEEWNNVRQDYMDKKYLTQQNANYKYSDKNQRKNRKSVFQNQLNSKFLRLLNNKHAAQNTIREQTKVNDKQSEQLSLDENALRVNISSKLGVNHKNNLSNFKRESRSKMNNSFEKSENLTDRKKMNENYGDEVTVDKLCIYQQEMEKKPNIASSSSKNWRDSCGDISESDSLIDVISNKPENVLKQKDLNVTKDAWQKHNKMVENIKLQEQKKRFLITSKVAKSIKDAVEPVAKLSEKIKNDPHGFMVQQSVDLYSSTDFCENPDHKKEHNFCTELDEANVKCLVKSNRDVTQKCYDLEQGDAVQSNLNNQTLVMIASKENQSNQKLNAYNKKQASDMSVSNIYDQRNHLDTLDKLQLDDAETEKLISFKTAEFCRVLFQLVELFSVAVIKDIETTRKSYSKDYQNISYNEFNKDKHSNAQPEDSTIAKHYRYKEKNFN